MQISIVQFCPEFNNTEKNISKIENYIDNVDSDIIVFPELCTSGYFFLSKAETLEMAEEFRGKLMSHFQVLSTQKNKIIVIGFPEKQGEKTYNSAAVLCPKNEYSKVYRKTHLFYRERFAFDEGDSGYFVIDYSDFDIKIGTMICYDWRFPEAARSLGVLGADLIVCPSNLVTKIWGLAMPARAIENKVYLAVANRIGTEKRNQEELVFNGDSAIYNYTGEILAKASKEEDAIISSEIYPKQTRDKSFNDFNDIFKDRKKEYYIF